MEIVIVTFVVLFIMLIVAAATAYRGAAMLFGAGLIIYLAAFMLDTPTEQGGLRFEGVLFTIITFLLVFPLYAIGIINWIVVYRRKKRMR